MDIMVLSRLRLHSMVRIVNLSSYSRNYSSKQLSRSNGPQKAIKGAETHPTHYIKRAPYESSIGLYEPKKPIPPHEGTLLEEISDGLEIIKRDIPKFKQECIDKLKCDINVNVNHGDFEYFERFNTPESINEWVVSADSDSDQGKSLAYMTHTDRNTSIFYGNICQEVPKDGVTERAGFCSMRSPLNTKSFERHIPYDWSRYTHLCLNVRGDGRNYMLLIHIDRFFDLNSLDLYCYPLYTHGGPYWQFLKIPLSHFLLSFKGRAQMQQEMMDLALVKSFSIAAGDFEGSFHLEVDYIALLRDETANNALDFRYEMYRKKPWEF